MSTIKSPGKLATCAELLVLVGPLCKYNCGLDTFLLTKFTLEMLTDCAEQDRETLFCLLSSVGQTYPSICLQIVASLVENTFQEFNDHYKTSAYAKWILKLLTDRILMSELDQNNMMLKIKMCVTNLLLLNSLSAYGYLDEQLRTIKDSAIRIIKFIMKDSKMFGCIERVLNEENHSYFNKATDGSSLSIKKLINTYSFSQVKEIELDYKEHAITGECLSFSNTLLDKEWAMICKTDMLSCHLISILLENAILHKCFNQDSYHMLRSVCTGIKLSWTALFLFVRYFNPVFIMSKINVQNFQTVANCHC